jgi:glycosyltransferase involved in cell wall biosynthesis
VALWYTHRHVSWRLRLATALADRIVTASAESFQLRSPKTRVIGHGIDTERFSPQTPGVFKTPGVSDIIVLAVGRRSPIKHYELLIDAAQILAREFGWADARVRIVGGDEGGAPRGYATQLQTRIEKHGLKDTACLVGPVPFDQAPAEYQRAAVHVNLCPTGGMDKAVLEGMAVGVPTLVRNETFRPVLGELAEKLIVAGDDARVVAARLDQLLRLSAAERRAMSERLRQMVVDGYSEQALAVRLAELLYELARA